MSDIDTQEQFPGPKAVADMSMFAAIDRYPDLIVPGTSERHGIFVYQASGAATEPPEVTIVHNARLVQTTAYRRHQIIDCRDVDCKTGLNTIPRVDESDFFLVQNGSKISAARQIRADRVGSIYDLPTFKYFNLAMDEAAHVAGVGSLDDLETNQVVEISALASAVLPNTEGGSGYDAIALLYSMLLRAAVEEGQVLWVQNVEKKYIKLLERLIGRGHTKILGEEQPYQGDPTIPVALNPMKVLYDKVTDDSCTVKAENIKQHLRAAFAGVDAKKLPDNIREVMIRNEFEINQVSASSAASIGYTAISAA